MKFTKKLVSLFLVLVLLLPVMVSVTSVLSSAASLFVKKSAYQISTGVYHTEYNLKGTGGTNPADVLTFNPSTSGCIPVVIPGAYAGSTSTLAATYSAAVNRYGYEVVGIINGSYFTMASGRLLGNVITDGRITTADPLSDTIYITFNSAGKMQEIYSKMVTTVTMNGATYNNAIQCINKLPKDGTTNNMYYFDSACGTKSDSSSCAAGYEVVFNKINNTELTMGGTLVGEVVKGGTTRGNSIGTNQFTLYAKSGTAYYTALQSLKAGDKVKITVREGMEGVRSVMESGVSAITNNTGWLVKDGVNLAKTQSDIGGHSTSSNKNRWTAYGTKPDGTYVFFTVDGTTTTLRDVAQVMISLGCNNVIRLDGGGSTQMYLANNRGAGAGYCTATGRNVPDAIMIVRRTSMAPSSALKTSLNTAISSGEDLYKTTGDSGLNSAIYSAKQVVSNANATENMYKKALSNLNTFFTGKDELQALVDKYANVKFTDYSETVLTELRDAYDTAKKVLANTKATPSQIKSAYEDLNYWGPLSGDANINVTSGNKYTIDGTVLSNYPDAGNKELTDGYFSPAEYTDGGWISLNDGTRQTYAITVDLGKVVSGMTTFEVRALQHKANGISVPKTLTVSVSDDGKNWKNVGKFASPSADISSDTVATHILKVSASAGVSGRYVKYTVEKSGPHTFLSEVVAYKNVAALTYEEGIYVTGIGGRITNNATQIYTSGTITKNEHNPGYATKIYLEWDEACNAYIVTKTEGPSSDGSYASYTLKSGEIMIAVHHYDNTSAANFEHARNVKVGDALYTSGLNIKKSTAELASYIWFDEKPSNTVLGDVNGNGKIDTFDYLLVRSQILGLTKLNAQQEAAADVTKDGKINTYDYMIIRSHILGLTEIK